MIIRSRAPLRLGLAGGGTDVQTFSDKYGGAVLNVTINLYAHCTIIPTNDGIIEFIANDIPKKFVTDSVDYIEPVNELILHKGVYNEIKNKFCPERQLSFRMVTSCDAPPGSGLGSSSTVVVAIIKAYVEWLNLPLSDYDIASLAYKIERLDLNLAGGAQDQYAATFGGLNYIEFYSGNKIIVNPLKIKPWIKNELEEMLILFFTGQSRDSAKIIKEQIDSTEKNPNAIQKMLEVKQNASKMKEAVLKGDIAKIINLLNEGWRAKKATSAAITNDRLNKIYDFVIANGGLAAKISGAGGGGFMMILCDPAKKYALSKKLNDMEGTVLFGSFSDDGVQSWTINY